MVTKPFHFEGRHRMRLADSGIAELQRYVDTLIVIPNQNLFRIANERTTFAEAFGMADQVLHSGVRSITDLMVLPGLINLDFADVRTVMTEMGKAMMGTGEATGEDRALMAAQNAIANPLLDEISLKGAKAVLVNITGGLDMTLLEVDEAANAISGQVDPDANIIFGAAFDPSLNNKIRVSVVATGMDGASIAAIEPAPRRSSMRAVAAEVAPEPVYAAPEPASIEPEPALEPELAMQEAEPAMDEAAPEPAPVIQPVQPKIFEPLRAASYSMPAPAEAPVAVAQAEPVISAPEPRAVARIVDPSVADEDDVLEPLFANSPHYADERRQKGGWLSLFGRPRNEPVHPSSGGGSAGGAQPALQVAQHEPVEDGDDLEIPSFLRRLAN